MDFSPQNLGKQKADLERREFQYLFKAGNNYTLMDVTNYDQFELTPAQVGSAAAFMKEGLEGIIVTLFMSRVIGFEIPRKVVLQVSWIGEGQAPLRPDWVLATLETGAIVAVPTHIKKGHIIWVDTVEGLFLDIYSG